MLPSLAISYHLCQVAFSHLIEVSARPSLGHGENKELSSWNSGYEGLLTIPASDCGRSEVVHDEDIRKRPSEYALGPEYEAIAIPNTGETGPSSLSGKRPRQTPEISTDTFVAAPLTKKPQSNHRGMYHETDLHGINSWDSQELFLQNETTDLFKGLSGPSFLHGASFGPLLHHQASNGWPTLPPSTSNNGGSFVPTSNKIFDMESGNILQEVNSLHGVNAKGSVGTHNSNQSLLPLPEFLFEFNEKCGNHNEPIDSSSGHFPNSLEDHGKIIVGNNYAQEYGQSEHPGTQSVGLDWVDGFLDFENMKGDIYLEPSMQNNLQCHNENDLVDPKFVHNQDRDNKSPNKASTFEKKSYPPCKNSLNSILHGTSSKLDDPAKMSQYGKIDFNLSFQGEEDKIGDFKIPQLINFPGVMVPGKFATISRNDEEDVITKGMRSHLARYEEEHETFSKYKSIKIQGLSVKMFSKKYELIDRYEAMENKENEKFQIRILSHPSYHKKALLSHKYILKPLKFLLLNSKVCHQTFINCQQILRVENIENSETLFNEWLEKTIFKPEDGNFPIFGEIIRGNIEQFTQSNFGPVQIYLIEKYFSFPRGFSKTVQVSLALIGYWYTNFHPEFFFKNLNDYWKLMFKVLGNLMSLTRGYSLKRLLVEPVNLEISSIIKEIGFGKEYYQGNKMYQWE